MSPNPSLGWLRLGLPALIGLAAAVAALRWASAGPPVVDAGALAANPRARLGSEVIVTGEWVWTGLSERGYMVVLLRGRDSGRAVCHFEEVPAADRLELERRLPGVGEVAVRGRFEGVEDGRAVLRGCKLLD